MKLNYEVELFGLTSFTCDYYFKIVHIELRSKLSQCDEVFVIIS